MTIVSTRDKVWAVKGVAEVNAVDSSLMADE